MNILVDDDSTLACGLAHRTSRFIGLTALNRKKDMTTMYAGGAKTDSFTLANRTAKRKNRPGSLARIFPFW